MKYNPIYTSLILLLFGFNAYCQSPAEKKARRILNDVTRRYQKIDVLEAKFTYSINNPQDHLNESQTGTLITQPSSNKYRIKLPVQELFSDGKNTYTWLKNQKEIQIAGIDTTSQTINPARLFTMYAHGFKYQYREESMEGRQKLDIIDLVPLNSKKISRAQVAVTRHTHQIYRIKLFDKNGTQTSYTVTQFMANPVLKGDEFTFDKKNYPGVEVVDIR